MAVVTGAYSYECVYNQDINTLNDQYSQILTRYSHLTSM